jgi:hypothetical protein
MTTKKATGKRAKSRTTVAWSLFWDSGDPGVGADYDLALKKGGRYFVQGSDGDRGPFDTLEEAIEAGCLACVTTATLSIRSTERTAEEVVGMLEVYIDREKAGQPLLVNGRLFIFNGTEFRPATRKVAAEGKAWLPDPEAVAWLGGHLGQVGEP